MARSYSFGMSPQKWTIFKDDEHPDWLIYPPQACSPIAICATGVEALGLFDGWSRAEMPSG